MPTITIIQEGLVMKKTIKSLGVALLVAGSFNLGTAIAGDKDKEEAKEVIAAKAKAKGKELDKASPKAAEAKAKAKAKMMEAKEKAAKGKKDDNK